MEENKNVYLISALNYPDNTKWTESVLDIALRQKFEEVGVEFHSTATFRRKWDIQDLEKIIEICGLYLILKWV